MGVLLRKAQEDDAGRLHDALDQLSRDIGDNHLATAECLRRAGFGSHPAFRAILALDSDETVGVAMYSPLFSTTRAATGVYVSDLWVAQSARGTGLGRRLLLAAVEDAGDAWGALFLKLCVYDANELAHGFYERLGFTAIKGDINMILDEEGLNALKRGP